MSDFPYEIEVVSRPPRVYRGDWNDAYKAADSDEKRTMRMAVAAGHVELVDPPRLPLNRAERRAKERKHG
jgi:hypothetical protein